jgi:hypothetical protein
MGKTNPQVVDADEPQTLEELVEAINSDLEFAFEWLDATVGVMDALEAVGRVRDNFNVLISNLEYLHYADIKGQPQTAEGMVAVPVDLAELAVNLHNYVAKLSTRVAGSIVGALPTDQDE